MNTIPLNLLEVYQCPFKKVRVGDKADGGYVVCETNVKYDALLSGGIGRNVSFENDFLKLYKIPAYAFDRTIQEFPQNQYASDKIKWYKKNIGDRNLDNLTNLIEYTEQYSNIFLKLDIEGGEYQLFKVLTSDHLSKISQIVIEIHEYYENMLVENVTTTKLEILFKHLSKTHTLLHVHANNAPLKSTVNIHDNNIIIPTLLELTLVRNTDVLQQFPDFVKTLNTVPYPQPCDFPNRTSKPEINLNYYPFLQE